MTVTPAQKRRVIERDGGFCLLATHVCTGEAQTTDHRANRGNGGAGDRLDHPANLIAACSLCNGEKAKAHGQLRLDLIDRGLIVIPDSTHEKTLRRAMETPIMTLDGRLFLLTGYDTRQEVVRV